MDNILEIDNLKNKKYDNIIDNNPIIKQLNKLIEYLLEVNYEQNFFQIFFTKLKEKTNKNPSNIVNASSNPNVVLLIKNASKNSNVNSLIILNIDYIISEYKEYTTNDLIHTSEYFIEYIKNQICSLIVEKKRKNNNNESKKNISNMNELNEITKYNIYRHYLSIRVFTIFKDNLKQLSANNNNSTYSTYKPRNKLIYTTNPMFFKKKR